MDESQQKYAGWKSRPRKHIGFLLSTRSTLRSRSQRVSDRTRADQRRAGRSNFGNLRDAAQTHAGRYGKLGFASIQDRIERDPFYLFNCSTSQITPDCCQFLEDLANSITLQISAEHVRAEKSSWEQVSAQGLSSCPTEHETSGSPSPSPKKPLLLIMPVCLLCPNLLFWLRSC